MTKTRRSHVLFYPLFALALLLLWQAEAVGDGVRKGLDLCYRAIIPSVFPFSVLSAYLSRVETDGGILAKCFSRLFRLPPEGVLPFFIGLFCGFPLGAKAVAEGYKHGIYTKEEAEHLLAFTNNTGLSFLLLGVGIGMRGRILDGVALALIQLLSACIVGMLMRPNKMPQERPLQRLPRQPLPLTLAIKDALYGTLTVSAFITFFSALLGVTSTFLGEIPQAVLACFLEIGTATRVAAEIEGGIILSAFAVGFSGISVHMQTIAVLEDTDLSISVYLPMKLVSGALSALLALPYFYLCS